MAAPSLVEPVNPELAPRDLTSDLDLSPAQLTRAVDLSLQMKRTPLRFARSLEGRYLSLLFEKPSLRTRMTFELAIRQLGGDSVASIGPVAEREPVKDVARNLERWTQGIVARVFSQSTIDELAQWSSVPVINALSDLYHPCQAMADVVTLKEHFGRLEGVKIAFVGDGNNVAHSLMLTAGRLGADVAVAAPQGYQPNPGIVAEASKAANITITCDPLEAVSGSHVVYTDVWTSMGQEAEAEERTRIFSPYRVGLDLFAKARPDAIFMHCLPAKRGQEVTEEMIESPRSVVFDQAENRLHAQKALLLMLLG